MYNINDRIDDLDKLGVIVENDSQEVITHKEEITEVLVSQIEFFQRLKDVIEDMKNCIGASGEYMDKKLNEWIEQMK